MIYVWQDSCMRRIFVLYGGGKGLALKTIGLLPESGRNLNLYNAGIWSEVTGD